MFRLKPTPFDIKNALRFDDSEEDSFNDSDNEIYKSFDNTRTHFNVDEAMNFAYQKNKDKILNESIRPIGDDIFAYYNSLNILCGNQGKGKSHIVVRDIIQISRIKNNNVHLVVYISKSGTINDSTFEAQQELIQLPIQCISDRDADKYLKQLDLYKDLYSKCCKSNNNNVNSETLQKMFDFLHVNKFNKDGVLNTIIIAEDFVKSALLKSAYFTNFITQLRHKHAIVYVNVQFFKSIPTDYKNNATTFVIFSGFSRQKLNYIYQQVAMPVEFEELWQMYSTLKNHDIVYVNVRENMLRIKRFDKPCLAQGDESPFD